MARTVQLIFLAFFTLSSFSVCANPSKSLISFSNKQPLRHQQMMKDLEFMTNIFHFTYGPAEWKAEHFGWNLSEEISKAKHSVMGNHSLTQKEFHQIVRNFCMTTKDYHVVPQFYSTELSTLPFNIQSAEGKYFITFVDQKAYFNLEEFPLELGDQVLLIDGKPVEQVVEEFRQKEIGSNNRETDQALAELYLTTRLGCSGHEVPKGDVKITYCKSFTDEPMVFSVSWDYHPEILSIAGVPDRTKSLTRAVQIPLEKYSYRKQFMTPHYNLIRSVRADNNEPSDLLGAKKSMIPPLGVVLWETPEKSPFHAYLFCLEDWSVAGYIRIPSYYVDGDSAAAEFAEIIELFQEVSDVLVVDQLNNGGGLVLYLYALAAMLTDYDLDVPMHRVMMTQEDVYKAAESSHILESIKNDRSARKIIGETLEGVVVDYNLAKGLLAADRFIINQWNSGKLFTDYHYLYGIEKITPHPEVNYTKPILILTNSLDFSAADFFPAIMQDNHRAKVMGSRTSGAGGYVERVAFPNLNGIEEIALTASFAMRKNGLPLENFGTTPDIPYVVSQNDLQNNYVDYKKKIINELSLLLPTSKGK